jgi:hypothetical protein
MIMLPVLLGRALDDPVLGDLLGHPLQEAVAELGPGLLAAAEHDRDLDLVALLEEPHHVTLLGLVVVRVDLRTELHLLDDRVDLLLAVLTGLDGRLVLELAVVHELADRRLAVRGHLDQVEVRLDSQSQGVLDADDADLFAVGADESYFRNADPIVDPGLDADGASSCRVSGARPLPPSFRAAVPLMGRGPLTGR